MSKYIVEFLNDSLIEIVADCYNLKPGFFEFFLGSDPKPVAEANANVVKYVKKEN